MNTINYFPHRAKGRIVYDPNRGDMQSRTTWWCVIEMDAEIARYYRWHLAKEKIVKDNWLWQYNLYEPSWGGHISVVRGERPRRNSELWKKFHKEEVDVRYSNVVRQSNASAFNERPDSYWFIDVHCPLIDEIRDELGLRTKFTYHMTIGRTY